MDRCQVRLFFVFLLFYIQTCIGVPLEDFYPFGRNHSDSRVPTNDDGSSPRITVSTVFPYFNQQFKSLFVNTNGAISFSSTLRTFTPSPFPLNGNRKIVAPYWCDIDTRKGGDVWYYETNQPDILNRASGDVREIFPDQVRFKAAWVFVATWDNVAFYGSNSNGKEKRNTFQCILITNGRHSFTTFLYNKIQWTTGTASSGNANTGLGGTPAQVGFDAGDGFNFKAINESRTAQVINVTNLSNVDIPGKFIYRIDTETVQDGGCTTNTGGTLTIFPRFGTMFGGTELSIGGPCLVAEDRLTLHFQPDQHDIPCTMSSKFSARCVTPMVYRTGDETVFLYVKHQNGESSVFKGVYTFVNPANTNPVVQRLIPDQWINGQSVKIRWNNLPFETIRLTIEQLQLTKTNNVPVLKLEKVIAQGISVSHRSHEFQFNSNGHAVVLRIRSHSANTTNNKYIQPRSVWSEVFVVKPSSTAVAKSVCESWEDADFSNQQMGKKDFEVCPCTMAQARLDISRFNPDPGCNTNDISRNNEADSSINCIYQSGATQCFKMAFPSQAGHDNQCCYDESGNLIESTSHRIGGTAQMHHYKGARGNIPYLSNIQNDVVPYIYCCQYLSDYSTDHCTRFLQRRPPSRCEGYIPPRPASTRGDPHLVTLDGLEYTFNGVGEFTLLQHNNGNFTLQARMEQFKDRNGTARQASVITSVVVQCDNDSDIVEVRLNEIRLCDVLINGHQLDFDDRSTVDIKGSAVLNSRGNTSTFDSIWTSVTCKSPNVAINVTALSKMINIHIVVAGEKLRGSVQGLLGNYNGRKDDDLTSAQGVVIPTNSSLEIIHHHFGLTWLTNATDSLFTYPVGKPHQSFQKKDFVPIFNVTEQCTVDTNMCGDDDACKFDLCTTNDDIVAMATRELTSEIKLIMEIALPACGVPHNISNGYWNFTGQLANLLCNTNYISRGPTNITCSDDGQWGTLVSICELTISEQPVHSQENELALWIKISIVMYAAIAVILLIAILAVARLRRKNEKKCQQPEQKEQQIDDIYQFPAFKVSY